MLAGPDWTGSGLRIGRSGVLRSSSFAPHRGNRSWQGLGCTTLAVGRRSFGTSHIADFVLGRNQRSRNFGHTGCSWRQAADRTVDAHRSYSSNTHSLHPGYSHIGYISHSLVAGFAVAAWTVSSDECKDPPPAPRSRRRTRFLACKT